MHTQTCRHAHSTVHVASAAYAPPPYCRLPVRSPRARCSPFGRNLRVLIPLEVSVAALTEPNMTRTGTDAAAPSYIHTYIRTYTHTYIHTYLLYIHTYYNTAIHPKPNTPAQPMERIHFQCHWHFGIYLQWAKVKRRKQIEGDF